MVLPIKRVSAADAKLKVLLYGSPGVGKTTFGATANDDPLTGPALVLNLEGGLLSVAGRGDVDEIEIRGTDEFEAVLTALHGRSAEVAKYRTVVVDSGSELAKKALSEWVLRNTARAERRGRGDADRTQDDMQLEDYGKTTAQMRRLFGMTRDLPTHVIVTALAKFIYPSVNGERSATPSEVMPDFTGSLQTSVMGTFDSVWYMYGTTDADGNSGRSILTQKKGAYLAKTRGARFSEEIGTVVENPTFPSLYATLIRTEGPSGAATQPKAAQDNGKGGATK